MNKLLQAGLGTPRERDFLAAELGITPTALHQRINRAIDDPAVHAVHPVEVGQLRRLREQRRARR